VTEGQRKRAVLPEDLTGIKLAEILAKALPHYPVSDAYERDHLPGHHWWSSQQEHVVAWLNEIDGPGAYGRVSRGLGARHFYTHFPCAPGLLWVAEALGEDADVVRAAARAAGGQGRPVTQCAAIRKVIPWSRIEQLTRLASSLWDCSEALRFAGRRKCRAHHRRPCGAACDRCATRAT